ncbi:GNAT family N-acetyltransferase [Streptomyces sp. NPDC053048]|uniref:GNAT family N-acetyltransferase n=1 Tax=Streptomyces sp. NPDC053048 TaxID=3365694 RepID=UPI0037D6638E
MFATTLGVDGAELRPLEPWQAEEYLAHVERGREHIGRYIALAAAAEDLASARAFLQLYADRAAADTGRVFGIWLEGVLVGGIFLRVMDVARGYCEAACWLEPSATGRGLMTRAARVCLDWVVFERKVHRVECRIPSSNTPSINVAKRLGMTRDGVLRESHLWNGVRHDMEVWSVLGPEWRELRDRQRSRRP